MSDAGPWFEAADIVAVDTPALLVYPDRIEENIRRMIAIIGDPDRLWPHVKTHKMTEVVQMQMAAGIRRFKCATIAEAEMVARCGADAVLLAHQPIGPKAKRFARLAAAFPATQFVTLIDSAAGLEMLAKALAEADVTVAVLVDVDNGMGRSGVAPGPDALELYQKASSMQRVRPLGLHVYDGHIRDSDAQRRAVACKAAIEPVLAFWNDLKQQDLPAPLLVAGGTPTFPMHAEHTDRICSPGTCLLWDAGYASKLPDLDFLPAAVVLARIISRPAAHRLCLDLGYKAVAADPPETRVVWPQLPDARSVVHSEEHLTIETTAASNFAIGDVLYGIPWHVCPTCAFYREALVIRDGRVADRWKVVARERMLTF